MKQLNQFILLMWKHFHSRKHRWIMTSVEIFLPIIIAYILCYQAGKFISGGYNPQQPIIGPVYPSKKPISQLSSYNLVYAPVNNFFKEMVRNMSEIANFNSTKAVENDNELVKFLSQNSRRYFLGEQWIGIFFASTETKPSKLNYEIRTTNSWHTDSLFPKKFSPENIRNDAYSVQGFAGLQMVVDSVFSKIWNYNFDFNKIQFQAFPYPKFEEVNPLKALAPEIIAFVVILTSLVVSMPLISNIIEEKESGVKELIKLVGVQEWLLQFSWFLNAVIFNLFSYTVVVYFLQKDFSGPETAMILNVPVAFIWICIILYCIANVAFCFMFCAIFHNMAIATSVFMLVIGMLVYAASTVVNLNSLFLIRLSCLAPVGALYQGFMRIKFFENHKVPMSFSSLYDVEDASTGVSLLFVIFSLIFDVFLYLLFSYYITAVNPGSFGTKKSPFFFLENLNFLCLMFPTLRKVRMKIVLTCLVVGAACFVSVKTFFI